MNVSAWKRLSIVALCILLLALQVVWFYLRSHFVWAHQIDSALEGPQRGSLFDERYSAYFGLMGGLSGAILIASFAVVAISRYGASAPAKNRFFTRMASVKDTLYNIWITYHVWMASGLLIAALVLSAALLVPAMNWPALLVTVLVAMALLIAGMRQSGRYRAEAIKDIVAIQEGSNARFLRLRAWLDRHKQRPEESLRASDHRRAEIAERIRAQSLYETKSVDRVLRALGAALDKGTPPAAMIVLPLLTLLAVVEFLSNVVATFAVGVLMLTGLLYLLRIAVALYVYIPDALRHDRRAK
jgi:hypothetical protein